MCQGLIQIVIDCVSHKIGCDLDEKICVHLNQICHVLGDIIKPFMLIKQVNCAILNVPELVINAIDIPYRDAGFYKIDLITKI